HDVFDHIHQSGFDSDSGELIPICDFAWHEIDSDGDKDKGLIPLAAASSAIARLLGWICGNGNLLAGGARAASLALLLGHNNDRYRSLAAIARAAGCERATLSRSLLGLRDQFNIKLSMRGSLIRDNCRQAQYESLKAGTHSSLVRKNKTQTSSD